MTNFRSRIRTNLILALSLIAVPAGLSGQSFEFWPGANYDPSVPSFEGVLGHAPGERIVSHSEILRFFAALEQAHGERIRVFEFTESWEGRELIYAVIGSKENMARLEQIQANSRRLADPKATSRAEADTIITTQPAICWLAYGVHGNEISSPDAALLTAYHLLASQGDPLVEEILAETLIVITPTQNPDGRDRFVNHYRMTEGLVPDAHPASAEHDEPWPGGRTNHYYFDLNRDWISLTQPEVRGHIKALLDWYPQMFVDLHEMGGNATYYFAPEAVPYNPHITSSQREGLDLYGRNNSKWFDQFGFLYFTREVFDAFYPGYGASWPLYHGSIAATYEQASARGLIFRRSDGTDLLFRDAVHHHFVASISTAEATAKNRETLLKNFYDYRRSAVEEGSTETTKSFIVRSGGTKDASSARKLAGVLAEQGVEVHRAAEDFTACGENYESGSFVIRLDQPTKRLVRTLLDEDVAMEEEFLQEQERRRQRNLGDEIYDVTGWALPLIYNLDYAACSELVPVTGEPVSADRWDPATVTGGRATVAYLVPWGSRAAAKLLAKALRAGLFVLSSDKPIVQAGRTYPTGTLILMVSRNEERLHVEVEQWAQQTGAEVVATDTGWVEGGVNFGSNNVYHVRAPRVALAWDRPTTSYSAGATRFVMERQFDYPVTPIRASRVPGTDLASFDVLILPEGSYANEWEESVQNKLKDWVSRGGTLIGIGSSVDFLASGEFLATKREDQYREKDAEKLEPETKGTLIASEQEYRATIQPDKEPPDSVSGVLVRAILDSEHWLNAGLPTSTNALIRGRRIFKPLTLDDGNNPAVMASADDLLVSGYLWEENRKQYAFKPITMVSEMGRGLVVGFIADPNFRAYMDGMNVMFLNAVFRGPARARPAVP